MTGAAHLRAAGALAFGCLFGAMAVACQRKPPPPAPLPPTPRPFRACLERMKDDDVVRDAGSGAGNANGGRVDDADTVIASLRPRLRSCYQKGLEEDPVLQGCAVVRAVVGTDGAVESSRTVVREGLSDPVEACLLGVVAGARFAPRSGTSSSVLHVPVTFLAEKAAKKEK